MPLSQVVDLNILLASPPIPRAGYGVPLTIGVLPAAMVTAMGSDLVVELTPSDWKTVLAALGVNTTDNIYLQQQALFGDSDRQPPLSLVGRRATPVAQVDNVSVDAAEAGTYTVTINGNDYTFVATAETTTQIRDALVIAINGGTDPVTATNGAGADDLNVTADEAGESFTISVTHSVTPANISTSNTTPNTGPQDDLAAIKAVRDDWYCGLMLERTSGQIREASTWFETEKKIAIFQTSDAAADSAAITDIGTELKNLARLRTALVYHTTDSEYVDAAWAGRMLPTDPGAASWAHQRLRGVVGITPVSPTNLSNKNYNWLEYWAASGWSVMSGGYNGTKGYGGMMCDGTFLDLVRDRDWFLNNVQIGLLELLQTNDKISYTGDGAAQIDGVIRGEADVAVSAGFLAAGTIALTIPKPEEQSSTNKGNRYLPNIVFGATAQGAIHAVQGTGNISP